MTEDEEKRIRGAHEYTLRQKVNSSIVGDIGLLLAEIDLLRHNAKEYDELLRQFDKQTLKLKEAEAALERFKSAADVIEPDWGAVPAEELPARRIEWLTGKVSQLQCREQLIHEHGRGYAEVKLVNRNLTSKLQELEKELSEAKFQANFNAGYINTLKKLGLPERLLEEYQLQKMKIRELEKELVAANHATELERNGYHQDRLTWNQCEERRTAAKLRPLEDALNVAESKLKEAETREHQLIMTGRAVLQTVESLKAREARLLEALQRIADNDKSQALWSIAEAALSEHPLS